MSIFRISKSEAVYFDLFIQFAEKANKAALALDDLVHNYMDVPRKVESIRDIEHECDMLVHEIMHKLNTSFVTPLDREDIDRIAHVMDNVVDGIEEAAQSFQTYCVTCVRDEARTMSKQILRSTASLQELMVELKNMRRSKRLKPIIIEINSIENEGDAVYREALRRMFMEETGAVEIIKWRNLFMILENSLDACEDVANIVEGVVMKHV